MTYAFHPDLTKDEFARRLEARFSFLQLADPVTVSDIDASIGKLPTRGRPVNQKLITLFQYADTKYGSGVTLETAIELAMGQFPEVKPRRRRTRTGGHTDPDHVKEMLIAEFKRYLSRTKHGLDPAIQYSRNIFFEFILTKQWDRAAAVFRKANKLRRRDLCERLNRITLKNAE